MKSRDEKLLEILHESIANKHSLLDSEKQFIKNLSSNITESIYKNIPPQARFYGSESLNNLDNIVHSKFTDDINFGTLFKNITKEQRRALGFVWEQSILNVVYCHLVKITAIDGLEVLFTNVYNWLNRIENKEVKVPFENKREVYKMIKQTITEMLLYLYNAYAEPGGIFHNQVVKVWYEWRKDRLIYDRITNKLPELEGIF